MEKFGERISELMFQANKMTTDQLGAALGMGGSTIRCWIEGRNKPLLSSAIKIADYFKCSLNFLFGYSENVIDFTLYPALPFYERMLFVLKERKVTRYRIIKDKIIPQTNFIDWSRGGDPYMQSVIDLANYLDVTIDYLVGRER